LLVWRGPERGQEISNSENSENSENGENGKKCFVFYNTELTEFCHAIP